MADALNTDWQYLNNQFANALSDSYGDTNIFATDHLSKLKANENDAAILGLFIRTDSAYQRFYTDYSDWKQSTAFWKGATSKTDSLLEDLIKTKLPKWEILVQVNFDAASEEYITLFPQGRTAFREVGKDGKIFLLKTFVSTLATYPELSAVRAQAEETYNALTIQRDRQQQREKAVKDGSERLRNSQMALFDILYRNLGVLMDKYGSNSTEVLNFFDVTMIRSSTKKDSSQEVIDIEPMEDDGEL